MGSAQAITVLLLLLVRGGRERLPILLMLLVWGGRERLPVHVRSAHAVHESMKNAIAVHKHRGLADEFFIFAGMAHGYGEQAGRCIQARQA